MIGHNGFLLDDVQSTANGPVLIHELYGQIPIRHLGTGLRCDPDYCPPMPAGAFRANVWAQSVAGSPAVTSWAGGFGIPRYFYRDATFRCVDCHTLEPFTAADQQMWYEIYKLPTFVEANRCIRCRTRGRAFRELSDSVRLASADPGNADRLLDEGRKRVACFELTGQGNLDKALACLRKAHRLKADLMEAIYWEAVVQELRGKTGAAELFRRYLESDTSSRSAFRVDAQRRLTRTK